MIRRCSHRGATPLSFDCKRSLSFVYISISMFWKFYQVFSSNLATGARTWWYELSADNVKGPSHRLPCVVADHSNEVEAPTQHCPRLSMGLEFMSIGCCVKPMRCFRVRLDACYRFMFWQAADSSAPRVIKRIRCSETSAGLTV